MLDVLENIIVNGTCFGDVCSTGLLGIFGSPIFLGLIGLFVVVAICMVLKFSIDITVLGGMLMFFILSQSVLPGWTLYLALIGATFIVGLMIKKFLGR